MELKLIDDNGKHAGDESSRLGRRCSAANTTKR